MMALAIPAALALLSLFGLVLALLGDGLLDYLAWIALGIPVAMVPLAMLRAKRVARPPSPRS